MWMKEWINPFITQENSLKTSLENIKRSGFSLQSKTPNQESKNEKMKNTRSMVALPTFSAISHTRKWDKIGF